jgi:hypothetical protein
MSSHTLREPNLDLLMQATLAWPGRLPCRAWEGLPRERALVAKPLVLRHGRRCLPIPRLHEPCSAAALKWQPFVAFLASRGSSGSHTPCLGSTCRQKRPVSSTARRTRTGQHYTENFTTRRMITPCSIGRGADGLADWEGELATAHD